MGKPTRTPPERLDIVEELWRKCVPNQRIEADLSVQWSVTRRTIRNYIAAVVRRNSGLRKSVKETEAERAAEFERARQMFEDIYLEAKEGRDGRGKGKDLKTALNAAHRRAHLLGLYPANRFEVTGANGKPLEIDPASAVDKLLAQIDKVAPRAESPAVDEGGGDKEGSG